MRAPCHLAALRAAAAAVATAATAALAAACADGAAGRRPPSTSGRPRATPPHRR
jgi:hypothetical protein